MDTIELPLVLEASLESSNPPRAMGHSRSSRILYSLPGMFLCAFSIQNGDVDIVSLTWTCSGSNELGVVAVVDGSTVHFTPCEVDFYCAKKSRLGIFTASANVRYFIEPIGVFAGLSSAPYSTWTCSALSSSFRKPNSFTCSRFWNCILNSERGTSLFAVASCGKNFTVARGRGVYPL